MQPPPAPSFTTSVTIDRPAADVHAFLASAPNWPQWAVINILAVEPSDDPEWWSISTPGGPAELRIRADAPTGVVDHDFRDESMEGYATVPARVVANGRGADFLMTVTQPPGVDDDFFAGLLRSVETELATLKKVMETDVA
jgi:hypothetical protein